jgi:hypothetical protein
VLDSGCTNYMTREQDMFTSFEENDCPSDTITFGDNSEGKVLGYGKIYITTKHSISKALLVDKLDYNLLSISQLWRSGGSYYFSGNLRGKFYLVDFIF